MKKALLLVLSLACAVILKAETVNVTTAGTLSAQLTAAGINASTVTNLTITGNLNSTDLATLKTMATNNKLSVVDLSGATIAGNAIPDYAFMGCAKLTSIILPNSVTTIGNCAFGSCSGLTSLTIPSSVTTIGNNAFYSCSGLTSLTIPGSVTTIGIYAFSYCSGLTSLIIPSSVTTIGEGTFFCCSRLTSLIIPNSVTTIGNEAFFSCSGLTSLIIPSSVTTVGEGSFYSCSGLTNLTIPSSVTTIGDLAFSYDECSITVDTGNADFSSLDGVLFNADKTVLIFCPISKTGSYTILNSVTTIGDFAFQNCSGLTSLSISNSVTTIGIDAFESCSGLTSLTIPNSVTTIGNYAFGYCSGLTSLTIPNSVTTIGNYAFGYCSGLTSLTIPNSVTTIGNYAFGYCSGLGSVYVYNTNPNITLGFSIFEGIKSPTTLYVPAGSGYTSTWAGGSWTIKPLLVAPSAGDGSSTTPYQIATLSDLYWLSQTPSVWSKNFIQTADIDASASSTWFGGLGFSAIGNSTTSFTGNYNGQGHVISGLNIQRPTENYVGLFGNVSGATIQKLGVTGSSIKGNEHVGGITGLAQNNTTIKECFASVSNITGNVWVGGIAGENNNSTITNVYAIITSINLYQYGGGITGLNQSGGSISFAYSSANVTAGGGGGGALVGINYDPSPVTNSYWNSNVMALGVYSTGSTSFNATPLTAVQMKVQSSFTGWDFVGETANGTADIWAISPDINGGFPCFTWQVLPLVTTQGVSDITCNTATGNGNITSLGSTGYSPTSYGICYSSTNNTPTIADSKVDKGSATNTGTFTASLAGLTPNTTYYVRAYATNTAGTSYGDVVSFTTSKILLSIADPVVSSRKYDGSTDASSVVTPGTVNGISTGFPNVTVSVASATFDTKTVATCKTITISYSISGADKDKYIAPANTVVTTGAITPKSLTIVNATAQAKTYDGNLAATVSGATLNGVIPGDDVTLTLGTATFADKNVENNIPVTVTGFSLSGADAGNYSLTEISGLTADITPQAITVTADVGQTKVYGESDPTFSYTISPALVGNDAFTGSLTRALGENVGNYAIGLGSLSAGSNYTISFSSNDFSITAKAITVTAKIGQSKVYGDADPALTYTVFPALVGSDALTGSLTRATGENVGNYAIAQGTLSAGSNYTLTFVSKDFSITPQAVTVTANTGQSKVYGDTDPTLTYSVAPALIGSDVFTGKLSRATGENVGTYAIGQGTLSAGNNYTLSFVSDNFSITPKAIIVTANAGQSKVYGDADPVLIYSVSPVLVGSDALSGSLTRNSGENVGNYAISQGSLASGSNYALSFVSADFSITPKNITVTANTGQTKVYGDSDPVLTYTSSPAFTGSDALTGSLSRATGENVGDYAIEQGSLAAGNNYTLTFVSSNFSITAKQLTITAPTVVTSKAYDGTTSAAITAFGQISGTIATDTANVSVSGTATYNDASAGSGKTITVVYTLLGSAAGNYLVPASDVITWATILAKITLAKLDSPQAGCQSNALDLNYTVLTGDPVQYQVLFGEKAITAGFQNISFTILSSSGTNGVISIPVPSGISEGVYTASLQMVDELNNTSILYPFIFRINLSADYIITKFDDVVLCNDASNRFTAYQWYKNGIAISGATKQFYNDLQGLSGAYSVRVVTSSGDTLMTCEKTIVSTKSAQVNLTVFPNPVPSSQNCLVQISGLSDDDLQGAVLSVYNMEGQWIYYTPKVEQLNTLNLNVNSGVYIGHLTTVKNADYTFRIVVVK